jgi:hypothetical protein
MIGNNSFYIPDGNNSTVAFAHDAVHTELKASQDEHDDDHVYWDQFNEELVLRTSDYRTVASRPELFVRGRWGLHH